MLFRSQFFYNIHKTLDGYLVACGIARIEGNIQKEGIRAALDWLQARHPLLRCEIVEGDAPYFRRIDTPESIPLAAMQMEDDLHWRRASTNSVYEDFVSPGSPLMRVTLLSDDRTNFHDLIVACHHSIIDADAIVSTIEAILGLHEDWKNNSLKNPDEIENLVFEPNLPEFKVLDKAKFIRQGIAELIKPSAKVPEKHGWNFDKLNHLPTLDVLDKEKSIKLLERCKQERTTVYGLMHALTMHTLKPYLEPENNKIRNTIAVKVRTRVEPRIPSNLYGAFISIIPEVYQFDQKESIWEAARSAKQRVNNFVNRLQPFKEFSRVRWKRKTDYSSFKGRSFAAAIDSLGIFHTKESYGDLKFKTYSQKIGRASCRERV